MHVARDVVLGVLGIHLMAIVVVVVVVEGAETPRWILVAICRTTARQTRPTAEGHSTCMNSHFLKTQEFAPLKWIVNFLQKTDP